MDINDNDDPGQNKTHCLQACASITACKALQLSIGLDTNGPMIHSQLLIVDINMFNHLNTFGRKVIIFSENVFQQKKVKSTGVCVNYRNNNGVFQMLIQIVQSGGHSKQNIQLLKQL